MTMITNINDFKNENKTKVLENVNGDDNAIRLKRDIEKAIMMYRYPHDVVLTVLKDLLAKLEPEPGI